MKRILSFIFSLCFLLVFFIPSKGMSEADQTMTVKAFDKGNYLRILFYVKQPVNFNPQLDGDLLNINFNTGFVPSFTNFNTAIKNYITAVQNGNDGKSISFKLNGPGYAYRKFISENFVGVDLMKKSNIKSATKRLPVPLPRKLNRVFETAQLEATDEIEEPSNNEQTEPTIENTETASDDTEETSPPDTDIENTEEATTSEQAATDENQVANEVATSDEDAETITEQAVEDAETTDEPEQQIVNPQPVLPSEDNSTIEEEVASESESESEFFTRDDTDANLFFPWDEDVAAAVFIRGEYLWVVFDQYGKFNVEKIVNENSEIFDDSEQLHNKSYTILRFRLKKQYHAVAYKEEQSWVVGLSQQKVLPSIEPEISISDSELHGSKLVIAGDNDSTPVRLIDPAVGDEMIVIPYLEEDTGYRLARQYTDYVFMKTAQGISIRIISDNIDMNVIKNNVEIAGPTNKLAGGAQVALRELREKERLAKERAEKLRRKGQDLTLIKFNTWLIGNERTFDKDLQELQLKIMEVDWSQKSEPRLNLARFYMAHGLYPESIGVLEMIHEYDEAFGDTNDVRMVEAAALYMSGRYDEAIGVFNLINLKELDERGIAEVKFWKAASNVQLGNEIKIDRFISDNPIKDKKSEAEIAAEDEASNTQLMYDTSSRLLKIIRKMDPDFVNAEEIQKLESTARFVTDHYHEAIKRFEESDLYRSSDAFVAEEDSLWWSTSDRRKDDGSEMNFITNIDVFLKYYPDEIYNDFAILAFEDKLKRNDLVVAEEIMSSIKEEERYRQKDNITFLRGLFYAKDEEDVKAMEAWSSLTEEIEDPYNRARAQFAMTVFQLRNQEIEVSEAIDNLNALRSLWRGGTLEFHILKMLGEFYMDEKNYMEGFVVWRDAISAFPGSDESLLIAKKMSDKFVQIFSQGDVDDIPKLDALTLYYEFRELTPIGRLGDEMISRLADRLIEVDLLDRAAALLTHQVRFRLIGEEKDTAAIKLVNVHLMNRNPQAAYDVLNATDNDNINEELAKKRKYLACRALAELDKSNKVLALLKGDDSHTASFLRSDVYWRNKVWRKVVEELETPFREIRRDERKVQGEEMNQLIKLAVAYALTERKKRLQVLYEDFEEFVPDNDSKKVFTFVATDRGPVDFRNLEQTVEFNDMKSFLSKYMKHVANNDGA